MHLCAKHLPGTAPPKQGVLESEPSYRLSSLSECVLQPYLFPLCSSGRPPGRMEIDVPYALSSLCVQCRLTSCSVKLQVCLVKSVKHGFRVCLKCGCEKRVEIGFIGLEDAWDSDWAAIAWRAGACSGAAVLVKTALFLNSISSQCTDLQFVGRVPVLESCVISSEISNPLAGMGHNLLIHTVLEIFLLMGVEEQVKTGQVAEASVFWDGCALLGTEAREELVVQVADLLLCDRWKWVDGVEPLIEGGLEGQLGEASFFESRWFGNISNSLDESRPLGQHIGVIITEVVDVLVEVIGGVYLPANSSLGEGPQCT